MTLVQSRSVTRKRSAPKFNSGLFGNQLSLFDTIGLLEAALPVLLDRGTINSQAVLLPDLPGITKDVLNPISGFTIDANTSLFVKGHKAQLLANLQAIKTARSLNESGNSATPEQQQVMAQFTGWGGLSRVWDETAFAIYEEVNRVGSGFTYPDDAAERWGKTYGSIRKELQTLLTTAQIEEAGMSTVNAFYTSYQVIAALWQIITRLGFKGGNILEPAAGTGHFIGAMPSAIRERSTVTAVEKDPVSAEILRHLYPDVTSHTSGFEDVKFGAESPAFDLVIGNVPFGDFKVYDRNNRDLSAHFIHNYFIGRSARLLGEGGLLALITSAGTFDAQGMNFRKALADEGVELIGAIRLPSCAFEANASTEVTTDLLLFRKRVGVERLFPANSFLHTLQLETETSTEDDLGIGRSLSVNEYYVERPHMMLGRMTYADEVGKGGLHGEDRTTLYLADPSDLPVLLQDAIACLPEQVYCRATDKNPLSVPNHTPTRLDGFTGLVSIKSHTYRQSAIITHYETLKTAYRVLLGAELTGQSEETTEPLRVTLNEQYKAFTTYFGTLNKNRKLSFLEEWDSQFPTVQALENTHKKDGSWVITKAAILNGRVYPLSLIPQKVETLTDALRLSLYAHGGINLSFMESILSQSTAFVRAELLEQGLAFVEPQTGQLVERSEYLSGDVRAKIAVVEREVLQKPHFLANLTALQAVLPLSIPVSQISFQLGSVWLPAEIITDFVQQTLDLNVTIGYSACAREYKLTKHSDWSAKSEPYGTKERKAIDLIEAALNSRSVLVTKTVMVNGEEKQVKDADATSAAVQAQEALQELFVEFARSQYAERIETIFNDRFNYYVPKVYSAPPLAHYPGANPAIKLYGHQFRGVERAKEQDTMFAHVVGSGKTYTMITAVMEMKRLGRINKAIIAVQNSTVAAFGKEWKKLYPSAIVYVPDKSDLEATNRKRFLQRIATNNFDGIVIPKSFLKLIPDDPTDEEGFIQSELTKLNGRMEHLPTGSKRRDRTVKEINKAKLRIKARRQAQADRKTDNMLHFGQLGIDCVVIDEWHTNKRLGFETRRRSIKGIDTQGSQDALQALTKCRTVQRRGGRVLLATGTPISNTMAEAWTALRFIGEDRLQDMSLTTFDEFAGTFGQIIPSFELTTSGQFKAVDRFAKFVNVPQLSELYRSHVDVILNDEIEEFKRDNTLPTLKNGAFTEVIIGQTEGVKRELHQIRQTLKWYEGLTGEAKKANSHIPLVMFGQARKATLDIRLLWAANPDEEGSKTNRVVGKVLATYRETDHYKGTQLVFSDLFQSPAVTDHFLDEDEKVVNPDFGGGRFNLFEDIKAKLIAAGIPESEVAIVPVDANKREPVFEQVRTGAIRVMLGTSERMGVGVNVQDRLAHIHHMDAPARPTDFEQRNGRCIRQGNLHASWGIQVEISTYGVEKTLDATAYGRMAIKKKFINQVLQGNVGSDTMEDISSEDDFMSMSFDQMMATLSGSQYALQYTIKKHELTRLKQSRKNHERGLMEAQTRIERARRIVQYQTSRLPQLDMEAEVIQRRFIDNGITSVDVGGMTYTEDYTPSVERLFQDLKAKTKRGYPASETIKINGLTIGLQGVLVNYSENGKPVYGIEYSWGLSLKHVVTAGFGLFISLKCNVEDVVNAPIAARQQIKRETAIEIEFSQKVGQPFKKQGEINQMETDVAALKIRMEAETAEPEPDNGEEQEVEAEVQQEEALL